MPHDKAAALGENVSALSVAAQPGYFAQAAATSHRSSFQFPGPLHKALNCRYWALYLESQHRRGEALKLAEAALLGRRALLGDGDAETQAALEAVERLKSEMGEK